MTIRKKSKEEIIDQVKGFLEYEKGKGEISKYETDQLLGVLSQNDTIYKGKNDIKKSLLGVLGEDQLEQLYGEYMQYYECSYRKLKKYMKQFDKNFKFFPDKYKFLIDVWVRSLLIDRQDVDGLIREIESTSIDMINDAKNGINSTISTLENMFPNKDDLLRLDPKIFFADTKYLVSNITALKELGIDGVDNFSKLLYIVCFYDTDSIKQNITTLRELGIDGVDNFSKLQDIIRYSSNTDYMKLNITALKELGIDGVDNFSKLQDVICYCNNADYIRQNITTLRELGIDGVDNFSKLQDIIRYCNNADYIRQNITTLRELGIDGVDNFSKLQYIIPYPTNTDHIKSNIMALRELGIKDVKKISKLESFIVNVVLKLEFYENNHQGYLKYVEKIIAFNISDYDKSVLISNIVKLPFRDIDNYLQQFEELCINRGCAYSDFLKVFDGKKTDLNLMNFMLRGFDISGLGMKDDVSILNDSIKHLYPNLDIKFNEEETEKILGFIDSIGGINKGYTILILTIEKLIRDGENSKINRMLLERLEAYKKIFDMYPEDRVPEGLQISVGLEFELTGLYADRYKKTTGKDYREVVDKIVGNAKIGSENEGAYEFATKPATNPMVTLLEIYLLNELNLLDINDMQKLLGNTGNVEYKGRNGTGYHLNIGSDSDIGVDENIHFIQNLCTILPRSGISNGGNIKELNHYKNIDSKSSNFGVFPNSKSKEYIEFRTYSVDDVELFEKNVIFNTYAVMGSQAQKKVSSVTSKIVMELRDNDKIDNSEDLMRYLEDNNLFKDNQDLKSKKVAVEFIFMQICVLRAISDYNHNFIDNELFGIDEISNNLNEPWKNYFMDLLCLDNQETIGYGDGGHTYIVVKNMCKNLYSAFKEGSLRKYLNKTEPFSDDETKKILNEYGDVIDESRISLVTTRLNKRLLWEKLIIGCDDTQILERSIGDKRQNINRIRNYIKGMDQTLKVDKQYLKNYFKTNMSLIQDNPYHAMNTDFMNKIINLNNFFLKKDDTNANGVLQTTILNGDKDKEEDISKFSIFEKGKMRKGYNYYQGGTENMLLHSAQKIALNYMNDVKEILNTDYENDTKNNVLAEAA